MDNGCDNYLKCIFGDLADNKAICTLTGYDLKYPFNDSCLNCENCHTRREAAEIIKELLQHD